MNTQDYALKLVKKICKYSVKLLWEFVRPRPLSITECPNLRIIPAFASEYFEMPLLKDITQKSYHSIPAYEALVPAYSAYVLKNGKCIIGEEEIFTVTNNPLKEITSQLTVSVSLKKFGKLLKPKKISGTVLSLSLSHLEDNYYHFNVEFLGRYLIFLQSQLHYDWIIFPNRTNFHKQFIPLLGIDPEKVLNISEGSAIIADKLVFTDLLNNWETYEYRKGYQSCVKQYCPRWLKEIYTLIGSKNESITSHGKKIYISRQKSHYRRVVNEIELLNMLRKYDFEFIILETLDVIEQIKLFSDVEFVVSPHGAGLVNISYSKNKIKALEIYPQFYHDSSLRIQSLIMGHDYSFYVGKTPDFEEIEPQKEDIWVDINIIEEWILKSACSN